MVVACRIRRVFQDPTPTVAVATRCLLCVRDKARTFGMRNGMAVHSRRMSSEIERSSVPPVNDKGHETTGGPSAYSQGGNRPRAKKKRRDRRLQVHDANHLKSDLNNRTRKSKSKAKDYLSVLKRLNIAPEEVSEHQPSQQLVLISPQRKHPLSLFADFGLQPFVLRYLGREDPEALSGAYIHEMSFADSEASTKAKDLLSESIQVFFYAKTNAEDDQPYPVLYRTRTLQMDVAASQLRHTFQRLTELTPPPKSIWMRTGNTTVPAMNGTVHAELTCDFKKVMAAKVAKKKLKNRESNMRYAMTPSVAAELSAARDEILKDIGRPMQTQFLLAWGFKDMSTEIRDLSHKCQGGLYTAVHIPDIAAVVLRFRDMHMATDAKRHLETKLRLQARFVVREGFPYFDHDILIKRSKPEMLGEGSEARARSGASNATSAQSQEAPVDDIVPQKRNSRTVKIVPWSSRINWKYILGALGSAGFGDRLLNRAGRDNEVVYLHFDTPTSAAAVVDYFQNRGISATLFAPAIDMFEEPQQRQKAVTSFVHRKIVESYPFEPEPDERVDVSIEQLRWRTANPQLDLSMAELEQKVQAELDMDAMMPRHRHETRNDEDGDEPFHEEMGAEPDEFQAANVADSVPPADHEAPHILQKSSHR